MTKKKTPHSWDSDDVAKAVAMWKAGKTAREIGDVVHRTRNSIIGKMHRLGMGHSDQTLKAVQVENGKRSPMHHKPKKAPETGPRYNKEWPVPPHSVVLNADPSIKGYSLMDDQFNNHSCKWWVSGEGADSLFCCRPVYGDDTPYCKVHYERNLGAKQPSKRDTQRLFRYLLKYKR